MEGDGDDARRRAHQASGGGAATAPLGHHERKRFGFADRGELGMVGAHKVAKNKAKKQRKVTKRKEYPVLEKSKRQSLGSAADPGSVLQTQIVVEGGQSSLGQAVYDFA